MLRSVSILQQHAVSSRVRYGTLSCIHTAYVSLSVKTCTISASCVLMMAVLTALCCAPGVLCLHSLDYEHTASWYRLGTLGVSLMYVLHMLSAESHCGCRKLLPAWWSRVVLLAVAALLQAVAAVKRSQRDGAFEFWL
jgi:hypothetical protein